MKPSFALSLSFEGIRLLHRSGTGWTIVGEVALDSPDLGGELSILRRTAIALDPAGLRSKIVLPNDQIRYLSIDTARATEAQVRAALEGATPYAIDELAWDVSRGGGRTYIAAVARETLDEAESFALDHRFGPVSFAAIPGEFEFVGEPFFGPTKVAATLLPAGEEVERDTVALRIIARSGRAAVEPGPGPDGGTVRDLAEVTLASAPDVADARDQAAGETADGAAEERETLPAPHPPGPPTAAAEPREAAGETGLTGTGLEVPPAAPAEERDGSAGRDKVTGRDIADAEGAGAEELAVVFASRSRPGSAVAGGGGARAATAPAAPVSAPAEGRRTLPPLIAKQATEPARGKVPPPLRATPPAAPEPRTKLAGPAAVAGPGGSPGGADAEGGSARVVPFAQPRPAAAPATDPDARIARFPLPQRQGEAGPGRAKAKPAFAPNRGRPRLLLPILMGLLVLALLVAALWLGRTDNVVSRFFGRGADPAAAPAAGPVAIPLAPPGEGPEVAGTTSPALPDEGPPPDVVDEENGELVAVAGDPVGLSDAAGDTPVPNAAATAAAALVAGAIAGTESSDAAGAGMDGDPESDGEGGVVAVTAEEAERFYAATGVWLRAPRLAVMPVSEDLAALSLSAADPPLTGRDAGRLPAGAPDAGLAGQADPPPAGTRLPRDDRGFILATPEGTVTPEGLVIFAGAPPLIPPARPGTVVPAGTSAAEAAVPAAAAPPLRPRARSAGPVPAGESVAADDAAAAGIGTEPDTQAAPGGVTLAGLNPPARPDRADDTAPLPAFDGPRPPPRPDGLDPPDIPGEPGEAAPAPEDPEAALAQTLASIVEGAADPLATATPRAVAVASRPDARPTNFARVVDRQTARVARAANAAREQSAGASLGTPEEAAETQAEEVEVAAAAPAGNVPRNVAEAATMENVMALREINLIGVYGTPNDRRALVRLGNGRYVRVKVGDSLDGGRVAAIGDDALNYVRRGRTVTLEVPGD
jgi:hypothetical protein